MYVLDTNVLIYYFKGMGNVAAHLLSHAPKEIGIPTIVLFELEVGIAKSTSPEKRTQQLAELAKIVHVLPFNYATAQVAAQIRTNLEIKGTPIGPYDMLIAATAVAHRAILVTRNGQEFSRIENLMSENWF